MVHLDVEVRSKELLAPALLCHKEVARAPLLGGASEAKEQASVFGSLWHKRAGVSNTMKLSTNESRASTFLDQ